MTKRWHHLLRFGIAADLVVQSVQYEQCKDPLFQSHWAGKNDIPTLASFPTVNTDLRICPSFNERASCCQQGFETEQTKYFEFHRTVLQGTLWRVYAHRTSVLATSQAAVANGTASQVDLGQLEVVKRRYQQVLSPAAQSDCLTGILTYVAGMLCFSCKPEWFQYAVISSKKMSASRLLRVRMAASVCVELWAACSSFGSAVAGLRAALRDSRLARAAPRAEASLNMFLSQQKLCNWAHDMIALHPFRQPTREEQDIPTQASALALPAVQRRLESNRMLDVMAEGRLTGFPRNWHGIQMISQAAGQHVSHYLAHAFVWVAVWLHR